MKKPDLYALFHFTKFSRKISLLPNFNSDFCAIIKKHNMNKFKTFHALKCNKTKLQILFYQIFICLSKNAAILSAKPKNERPNKSPVYPPISANREL